MTHNKTFLKLHKQQTNKAMGFFRDRYEVLNFDYQFYKPSNKLGVPDAPTMAGSINISIKDLPTQELCHWILNKNKFENGELSTLNMQEQVLDKMYFEKGRLIGFKILYDRYQQVDNMSVQLTIIAQKILLGETEYNNIWK